MKPKKGGNSDKGAIEILEEATQILRLLPADIHVLYYIGSLPFVLVFLYFWADMSRGALAHRHVAQAAFLLSAAYIWMKCWQAAYCVRIRAQVMGEAKPTWTLRRILRLIAVQTALQPLSFIALPVASVILLPFAWVYAFFHNVSVYGNGHTSDIKEVYREAGRQAKLVAAQNHIFLLIYSICGIFVFLNLAMIIYLLPRLLSMFLGIETLFSRTTWGMFNTTLLMATLGVSYLALNPLAKAVYVLRCFYGESRETGADLKVELKKYTVSAKMMMAVVLLLGAWGLGCLVPAHACAQEKAPAINQQASNSAVSAAELNRSIEDVVSQREYSWRMPREKRVQNKEKGLIDQFISGLVDTISDWFAPVKKWFKSAVEWVLKMLTRLIKMTPAENTSPGNWQQSLRLVLLVLIVAAIFVLGFVMWRVLRAYRRDKIIATAPLTAPEPDMLREEALADEMPADRWLKLAETLMSQGDLRSALRAFYLASLSVLARQNVILIARFKSNREYERELYRKAHHAPELLAAFSGNMRIYEGIWYGMHAITDDTVRTFKENQTRIMTIANQL